MGKPVLPRVYEPDEDLVHFSAVGCMDAVTLCGHTDWQGESEGVPTKRSVTCLACADMVYHIQRHRKETGLKNV